MRTKLKITGITGLALGAVIAWAAPTPSFVAMPVLTKVTGTGCGPCGDWGWTQMETAVETYGSKSLILGSYDAYYSWNGATSLGHTSLENSYSAAWNKNFKIPGFPSFYVDTIKSGAPFTIQMNASMAKTVDVGMTFHAWVEGSYVKVARYIQSNGVQTGNFSISTLLIEDSVMHVQAGLSKLTTQVEPHHYVLRAMPNTNQTGDMLAPKAVSGNLYVDTVSLLIRSEKPAWNKNKFKIGLVLWKNGNVYNAYTRPISQTWDTFDGTSSSAQSSSAMSSSSLSSSSQMSSSSGTSPVLHPAKAFGVQSTGTGLRLSWAAGAPARAQVAVLDVRGQIVEFAKVPQGSLEKSVRLPASGAYVVRVWDAYGASSQNIQWNP